tara:strand:- start:6316 stop:6741 length:426 start_codon:yes stop_codon:yes gene_type:complete
MIKYNLKCAKDHEFESWFSSSNEFDKLSKKNLLECIFCSSKKITKSIMAPSISGAKIKENELIDIKRENLGDTKKVLIQLRKYIENNFDYVGKDFSKKVREVYYDKKNSKAIYGTATSKQKEELSEEGIDLISIPWVNKDN